MRIITLIILMFSGSISFGQKKQVCFTYDDLPVVTYGMNDTAFQKSLFRRLMSSLIRNNIPAIGFVNEQKLYNGEGINSFQRGLLENWVQSGLDLGNHTYSHPDYNHVSFQEFTQNILKGEVVTKEVLARNNKSLVYFRHPFLHVGNTKAKADSLTDFLDQNNYLAAPVTIDNEDYLFAVAYKRAFVEGNAHLMMKIGQDYISYMEKKLLYFEKQANTLFSRNINQIILLHASLINADYADALADMFRNNNYEFVSMDDALEDDAYNTEITAFGKWGISWIDRWALSQGKKGDFFKDEPITPEYIKELAAENKY